MVPKSQTKKPPANFFAAGTCLEKENPPLLAPQLVWVQVCRWVTYPIPKRAPSKNMRTLRPIQMSLPGRTLLRIRLDGPGGWNSKLSFARVRLDPVRSETPHWSRPPAKGLRIVAGRGFPIVVHSMTCFIATLLTVQTPIGSSQEKKLVFSWFLFSRSNLSILPVNL